MTGLLRRLRAQDAGISTVEFGLVSPVLILMLMGFYDLAHSAYTQAVLQGSVEDAGRLSTLQTGTANSTIIDNAVKDVVRPIVGQAATFASERLSYASFSDVGTPERFVDKAPYNNRYDAGECFEDVNGNGAWDADRGRTGQGNAQDVVVYKITVTYPRMFPMAGFLGWSANQAISASTVLRNQPWAPQTIPPVTVCP